MARILIENGLKPERSEALFHHLRDRLEAGGHEVDLIRGLNLTPRDVASHDLFFSNKLIPPALREKTTCYGGMLLSRPRMLRLLEEAGLPLMSWTTCRTPTEVLAFFDLWQVDRLLLKRSDTGGGTGVTAFSREELEGLAWHADNDIFCIEVNPANGDVYKAETLNDRLLISWHSAAPPLRDVADGPRTTGIAGAYGERELFTFPTSLEAAILRFATRARRLGLGHCSVDFMKTADGRLAAIEANVTCVATWWTQPQAAFREAFTEAFTGLLPAGKSLSSRRTPSPSTRNGRAVTGLRILITNRGLVEYAGTELYARDVALELARRGHRPMLYSTQLGEVAEELRSQTIPVVDDLGLLGETPDLIHGQHQLETMTALAFFPDTPAVSFCHGWRPWEEAPPRFPRVRAYVTVDEATRDRLVLEHGIPPGQVHRIPNFVDLERFKPRWPLPRRPERVLLYSNYVTPGNPYHLAAEAACSRAGLRLDVVGKHFGNAAARPEDLLCHFDIVLAQGRSAIEALAVGASVVITSSRKFGPLVTGENVERLRALNFGIRTLNAPVSADHLYRQLMAYDADDAARVCTLIRETAGLDRAVDRLEEIYRQAVAASPPAGNGAAEARAVARYLRRLSPRLSELYHLEEEQTRLREQVHAIGMERERLARTLDTFTGSLPWKVWLKLRRVIRPARGPDARAD